jgi:hypothetical protein
MSYNNHFRSHSLNIEKSLLRKNYGKPKPVKDYKRFIKDKIADTGLDTKGAIIEMMKNDIIRPLERPQKIRERTNIDTEKWALQVQKNCTSIDHLPKIQQYKDYYFVNRTPQEVEKYKSSFLKTDNVSVKYLI